MGEDGVGAEQWCLEDIGIPISNVPTQRITVLKHLKSLFAFLSQSSPFEQLRIFSQLQKERAIDVFPFLLLFATVKKERGKGQEVFAGCDFIVARHAFMISPSYRKLFQTRPRLYWVEVPGQISDTIQGFS
jgi:hypothetical protein